MSSKRSTHDQQEVKVPALAVRPPRRRVAKQAVSAGAVAVVGPDLLLDDDGPPTTSDRPAGLTDMQWAFVQAFSYGPTAGNGTKSCVVAGYSENSAPTIAAALRNLPHVRAAIDAQLRAAIGEDLAASAVQFLRVTLDDPLTPLKLRSGIALKLVEFSGVVDRTQAEKTKETGLGGDKPIGELSRKEIEEIVRKGAGILAAAASLPPAGAIIEGHNALITDLPTNTEEE